MYCTPSPEARFWMGTTSPLPGWMTEAPAILISQEATMTISAR